jgi:hypothetical protein
MANFMNNLMPGEWDWKNKLPSLPSLGTDAAPTMPTDDITAQLLLKRRLAQADALRGAEMPQGQMVSGHYVAPSWTQYLANVVGKIQAGADERAAMQQYGEYETNKAKKYADLLGATDNAKFQEGLAQMPEFASDLVKARLAAMNKEETGQIVPAGATYYKGGQAVYTAPTKPEKLFGTVNPSDFTTESLAKYQQTGNYQDLVKNPQTMTPYQVEELKLRKAEIANKSNVDQGSVDATASMIANGQVAPLSGFAMKTPWGQKVMQRVAELNPQFSGATFANTKKAVSDFNTGKQGNTVRSLNVATSHLDTLGNLADALNTGNVQALNKVANYWKSQTGQSAPTNFEGAKKIVADEVVKAVVGSGGGVADREEAARTIQAANSPAQLRGVIDTYKELMHGQLNGLRQQYEQSTNLKDFDKYLSPSVKAGMEGGKIPEGTMSKSKSGKDIVYRNGQWEYK